MKKILATIVIATFVFGLSGVSFASLSFDNGFVSAENTKAFNSFNPVKPPQPTKSGFESFNPVKPPQPTKSGKDSGVKSFNPVKPPQPTK